MKELLIRSASAAVLAAVYITLLFLHQWYHLPLFIFLFVFGVLALVEFYRIATFNDLRKPQFICGVFAGIFLLTLMYIQANVFNFFSNTPSFFSFVVLGFFKSKFSLIGFILFLLLLSTFTVRIFSGKLDGSIYSISTTIFGVVYVIVPLGLLLSLVALPHGPFLALLVTWSTAMTDVMGYIVGRFFGTHKMNLPISPNKTWEGYIGGVLGQLAMTFIFYVLADKWFTVPYISNVMLVVFSVAISFTAIMGDLSESLLKRDAAVKDSGNLIPGHGGILDRIDSLLFTVPVMYYLVLFSRYLKDVL